MAYDVSISHVLSMRLDYRLVCNSEPSFQFCVCVVLTMHCKLLIIMHAAKYRDNTYHHILVDQHDGAIWESDLICSRRTCNDSHDPRAIAHYHESICHAARHVPLVSLSKIW